MKLLLGLGNIGTQYTRTRHNFGFMIVDQLAVNLGATWRTEAKFKADIAESQLAGERLILAKPHTMMNLSGEAAQAIMQFYKISPPDVWAVFDDVDTPFGRLRLRVGGGGSGHQGVNSLIRHLGSDFVRVKAGISLNDRLVEPSEVYVLKPFKPDEQAQLPTIIEHAAAIIQQQLTATTPAETTSDLLSLES